ncbi:MAG: hypothetical protein ACFN9G_03460 [Cardiobacterium sp.]
MKVKLVIGSKDIPNCTPGRPICHATINNPVPQDKAIIPKKKETALVSLTNFSSLALISGVTI